MSNVIAAFVRARKINSKRARKVFCSSVYLWLLYDVDFDTCIGYNNILFGVSGLCVKRPKENQLTGLIKNFVRQIDTAELEYGRTLGRGTYASVMLARYKKEVYAYKIQHYKDGFVTDNTTIELAILSSLKHEHIVNCHGFTDAKTFIGMLLDYYPHTLDDKIVNGRQIGKNGRHEVIVLKTRVYEPAIPQQIQLLIGKQLCSALEYIHSRRVLHLDLNPNNVIVDTNWHIKIIDFGLSCIDLYERHMPFCAMSITPPEYIGKKGIVKLDESIDYWQLKLIMLEMELSVPPTWCNTERELKLQLNELKLL